tara:strand:- start:267 stop:626 length:360 start_codon:yes stop_codon:yes gene_type:complete
MARRKFYPHSEYSIQFIGEAQASSEEGAEYNLWQQLGEPMDEIQQLFRWRPIGENEFTIVKSLVVEATDREMGEPGWFRLWMSLKVEGMTAEFAKEVRKIWRDDYTYSTEGIRLYIKEI